MPGSKSILGVDLRVSSVKIVELENGVLKNSGLTEVPCQLIDRHPELEDAKVEALRDLVQSNKITAREAVVVVGGSETFVKLIALSELPRAEAAQAIRWKLAEEISFPIEDALFDFYPVDKTSYMAACIPRRLYQETLSVLNKAGLKLTGITVLPDALQEVFGLEITEKITSIIYMGKRTTNISIFRFGNFEFNRELNIGGENITQAMSGILVSPEGRVEINAEEAEKIKTERGIPVDIENYPNPGKIPLSQLQAMVRPALEKIQSEIARTFEYYNGQSGEGKVDKIILTGGSSLTPHLKEFLSQGLGIAVASPEPLPKLNPQLSAALGAALSGARRINLMPEDVKQRWKFLAQKFLGPRTPVLVFAGSLILIYFFFWARALFLQVELGYINRRLGEYRPRLAQLDAIERVSREEEKRKLTIKIFEQKRNRVPRIFEEISRLIPESANLNTLSLSPAGIHFSGTVFKKGEAAETILSRFVIRLSSSPLFEGIKLVQVAKNPDYATEAFNFEIVGKIREIK